MIHDAKCDMTLSPEVRAQPTRVIDAEARLDLRAVIPVSPEALGGKEIRLVIKGENAALLLKLLAALKEPGADAVKLLEQLKGLHENSNLHPDAGPDGGRTP